MAAFATLVSLLELIPADARRTRVMPVLRDHMQPFDLQPPMQICVARHFGTLLNLVGGLWGGWQGVMGKGGPGEVFASADICLAALQGTSLVGGLLGKGQVLWQGMFVAFAFTQAMLFCLVLSHNQTLRSSPT